MAYTAFEKMRKENVLKYGEGVGPIEPSLNAADKNDLKSCVLRFIHDDCEGLRFDQKIEEKEKAEGRYYGQSYCRDQIPYNMQMDADRLSLEREIEKFMDSGVAEDAYTVYYCFLKMFFGQYGRSKKMIELLSEYENNASSLLMKHRDHYSHSVYVFLLGLAIYESNDRYREAFRNFYGPFEDDRQAACFFLEFWGMTSLFHDIGYPFELPFEEVMSYFETDGIERKSKGVYIAYRGLEGLTGLSDEAKAKLNELYGKEFTSLTDILAYDIYEKMGETYGFSQEYIKDVLDRKPAAPNEFNFFMDHAWFSAARLYEEMAGAFGVEGITRYHIDVLSAIVLHNSLYKFSIAFCNSKDEAKAPLKPSVHPLAYLLMICDELQCWDRTAYGRNSRTELHPMGADFDFSDSAIKATYCYDKAEHDKIEQYNNAYSEWEKGEKKEKAPKLKAYSEMAAPGQPFLADIEKIVDTQVIPLTVRVRVETADRKGKRTYLSESNFLHIYDFAVILNSRFNHNDEKNDLPKAEEMEREFDELSLEYQLTNINQAKRFDDFLDKIGLFYTDRPVDFEMVTEFTQKQAGTIAVMEHESWIKDHLFYGWIYGDRYADSGERERMRMHKLLIDPDAQIMDYKAHYESLSKEDQDKDIRPFATMLKLIKKFDGLRIYSL